MGELKSENFSKFGPAKARGNLNFRLSPRQHCKILRLVADGMTQTTTTIKGAGLISPHGGDLKNLVAEADEAAELRDLARSLPVSRLSQRSVCDLELLATGAFSPLDRFMGKADYESVIRDMRLATGHIFPIPVTLPVAEATNIEEGSDITLVDTKQNPLAVMRVEEIYEWDRLEYAKKVLDTQSIRHPVVAEIASWGSRFVSGPLRVFALPRYFDFPGLRLSPAIARERLGALGNPNVVAFQTRNPLHRGHEAMTKHAMHATGGVLLMHPVVGLTKAGDIDHYCRVRTYRILAERYYHPGRVLLSLLPLAMRFAGPREALWHALIRRNFGANHFIVGRDHASPGADENGQPFYEPFAAQDLVSRFENELGVKMLFFDELVYFPDADSYEPRRDEHCDRKYFSLSGTSGRQDYLRQGRRIPEWFMRPEVAAILTDSFRQRHHEGFCIWFTGLSGSGKSTTAEIVTALLATYGRRTTLLDGDVVRTNLSVGLGFDRAGRDANIRRIGFVASEVVRHGGVAVCAAISPYRETRNEVRRMIGGNFIEIFVSTPLEVCEQRDPKGMYAKARQADIENFTGVDDVYEEPQSPEIVIDTVTDSAEENAHRIIDYLLAKGLLRADYVNQENE